MMADWLSMGGYAGFIWFSYGASFLGLAGVAIWSWRDYHRTKAQMAKSDEVQ